MDFGLFMSNINNLIIAKNVKDFEDYDLISKTPVTIQFTYLDNTELTRTFENKYKFNKFIDENITFLKEYQTVDILLG